jgi:hypothetical protein
MGGLIAQLVATEFIFLDQIPDDIEKKLVGNGIDGT